MLNYSEATLIKWNLGKGMKFVKMWETVFWGHFHSINVIEIFFTKIGKLANPTIKQRRRIV